MANTTWMASPLFAFLLSTVLKATVLLLAAGLASRLLRTACHRHLVWALTFVALLALPLASALLPPMAVVPVPTSAQEAVFSATTTSRNETTEPAAWRASTPPVTTTTHMATPKRDVTPRTDVVPAAVPLQTVIATEHPATSLLARAAGRAWTAFSLLVWLTGMVILLFFDLRDRFARRRLARSATPLTTPPWRALLDEQCQALGLRRAPQLLISPAAAVPMTWGVMHPVILLPATAKGWPTARRRSVLLHELAHIARCDALGLGLARLAGQLYWFNPLVWWAQRRLQLESEHAADDRVLHLGIRASSYADHLLAAARALHRPVPGGALAMARPSQLPGRIRAILDSGRARTPLSGRRLLAGSAAAALLVVTVGAAAPRPPKPPEAPSAPAPPAPRAHLAVPDAPLPPTAPSAAAPALAPRPLSGTLPTPEAPLPPAAPVVPSPAAEPWPAVPDAPLAPTPALAPSPTAEPWPVPDAPLAPTPALPPSPTAEPWPIPDAPLPPTPALAPTAEPSPMPDAPSPASPTLAPSPAAEAWPVPDATPALEAPPTSATPATRVSAAVLPQPVAQIADAGGGTATMLALGTALPAALGGDGLLCPHAFEQGSVSVNSTDHRHEVKARKGACKLTVKIVGEVDLLVDDSGIGQMARGAKLMIEESRGTARRRLDAKAGAGGNPIYTWQVDGREEPYGAAGQSWLRAMMPILFRLTGLRADERVAHIYGERGTDGVLQEIELVRGDYTQRLYFDALFAQPGLSTKDLARAVRQAGEEIGSDFEVATLLTDNHRLFLTQPETQAAYLKAARSIGSDFEMRRTLAAALSDGDLTPTARDALLVTARDIGSDFEAATLLIDFANTQTQRGPLPDAFFDVVRSIGSDFEMRRVLDTIVARQILDPDTILALLRAARDIGSDFELAELLVHLAERHPLDSGQRTQFNATARGIGSDHESNRVYAALARHEKTQRGKR